MPGFASEETLLYSPELKFYSNRVKMDENLNTSMKGLHCLGDSSGWTRGLMIITESQAKKFPKVYAQSLEAWQMMVDFVNLHI